MKFKETKDYKITKSENYNFVFNKNTGFCLRFGKTLKDDPIMSPWPELLDIEISTVCHGINGKPCSFCYKGNGYKGKNMSFETFKKLLNKIPKQVTQIAFGIGDINGNKDLFKILKATREYGIIPNITINGMELTEKIAKELVKVCGAISVSRYDDKDVCYNAIKMLTDAGGKQINIHCLVAEETIQTVLKTCLDTQQDKRLEKLNAIVFLDLKPIGPRNKYNRLDIETLKNIINSTRQICNTAGMKNTLIGMDSCMSSRLINTDVFTEEEKKMMDPCESSLFSGYIDVNANFYPCSFIAETDMFKGINVLDKDFIKDIWNSKEVNEFRKLLIKGCRTCPIKGGKMKKEINKQKSNVEKI